MIDPVKDSFQHFGMQNIYENAHNLHVQYLPKLAIILILIRYYLIVSKAVLTLTGFSGSSA